MRSAFAIFVLLTGGLAVPGCERPAPSALPVPAAAPASPAGPAASATSDLARARRDFDAIIRVLSSAHIRRACGPSLTALVRAFVSHGSEVVRQVEEEAWQKTGFPRTGGFLDYHVDQVVSFLHGMNAPSEGAAIYFGEEPGLDLVAGAVLLRECSGGSDTGPGYRRPLKATGEPMQLGEYVGDRPIRSFPAPRGKDLLDVATRPEVAGCEPPSKVYDLAPGEPIPWSESARLDFGMALGEACAADDDAFAELLRRAATAPADPMFALALGWSRRPEAIEILAREVRRRAVSPGAWGAAAAVALHHASPAAFDLLLRAIPEAQGDVLCRALRGDSAVLRCIESLEAARDAAARISALERLAEHDPRVEQLPAGDGAPRLFRALLRCGESADVGVRGAALRAVGILLYWLDESSEEGWRSLAGHEAHLRQLVADLESGRLEFLAEEPGVFDPVAPHFHEPGHRAQTGGVRPGEPEHGWGSPWRVHASADWAKGGLLLTLRNDWAEAFGVDPVSLRYGIAGLLPLEPGRGSSRGTNQRRLSIHLGCVRARAAVPARCLVRLEPDASTEFLLPRLASQPERQPP